MFRPLVLLALLGAPGCQTGDAPQAGAENDDRAPDQGSGAGGGCEADDECTAVGSSCCDCPSFATVDTGYSDGCEDVGCEPPADCPRVEAVCVSGGCQLRCQALVTEQVCSDGFARDSFGCLLDACADGGGAPPAADECSGDAECVQVPEDCCGCERGGSDTAVPASEADAYLAGQDCPDQPQCPDVDVCDPSQEPRCVDGVCQLAASTDAGEAPDAGGGGGGAGGEGDYCGTSELGLCAEGMVCVLNDPDAPGADSLGVGICRSE